MVMSILLVSLNVAPELNFDLFIWTPHFPFITLIQPIVRQLNLIAIDNFLLEQTVFITDTTSMSRIAE
ncbi:hypothetical protein D3C75_1377780 [compost metagenome]